MKRLIRKLLQGHIESILAEMTHPETGEVWKRGGDGFQMLTDTYNKGFQDGRATAIATLIAEQQRKSASWPKLWS